MNTITFLLSTAILCVTIMASAQNISSKVYDSKTQEPLALVNVVWEQGKGVSTNEEGAFYLPQKYEHSKKVQFSLIGYKTETLTIGEIKNTPIIYLSLKPLALKNVLISNTKLTAEAILDSVYKYLPENKVKDGLKQRKLFFREINNGSLSDFSFDLKKSSIAEITSEFIQTIIAEMPRKNSFSSEILANRYSNSDEQKLAITKANKLYDLNGNGALEATFNKLEALLNRNVKSNSYYKIKTGLLGFKLQADSTFIKNGQLMDVRNELGSEDKQENFFLYDRKEMLESLVPNFFLHQKTKIQFLNKRKDFNYTLEEESAFIDNEEVYQLNVTSKGSNKYSGKLYVNTYDFGVMRVDFKNNKPLRSMKLFGVNYKETLYKGTSIYKKGPIGYELAYMEKTLGNSFGVDRPFKILEKNKQVRGRRKQNVLKFDMDMQMDMSTEYQILILSAKPISNSEFEAVNEKAFAQPKNWTKYQTNFWDAYPKIKNLNTLSEELLEVKSTY